LSLRRRPAGQDGVGGRPQVRAGDRLRTSRPRAIELTSIDEATAAVEQEEVWRAGGTVCARYGL
jgi:hypothetical protein